MNRTQYWNILPLVACLFAFLSASAKGVSYPATVSAHAALPEDSTIFSAAEVMPSFPGGVGSMYRFLSGLIEYPETAKEVGAEGKVLLEFIVEKDGRITGVRTIKTVHPDLGAEAVRVVQSMPRWIPGKMKGKPVRVRYNLPIQFKIPDDPVEEPADPTEKMPEFPGGQRALFQYLSSCINYPESCHKKGIEGRVLVRFIVGKDGNLEDITVIESVHPDLDAEAVRVVKRMPKWRPGIQRGKTVRTSFTMPITFRIPLDVE